MATYKAPIKDIRFLLEEVLDFSQLSALEGYEDYDLDTVMAMIEQISKFCINEMMPINGPADLEGLHYDAENHTVTTPSGYKELYQKYIASGMTSLTQPVEYDGQGAPETLGAILSEIQISTNLSFTMCPGLSHGAMEALVHYASEDLLKAYMPKLVSGEWSATMCLTEPQCGTDLGMIATKAEPHEDHYHLTGTKIWITFGEHDMTDNIIHLVLARLPDAPEGIKGISLFLVPKVNLDGERNGITCGGLEEKMGIHGSPTCVMNMEGAKGWLIGEPHKGMRAMFAMMNMARLLVGMQGLGQAEIAYQTALSFAKDRRQSRSLDPAKREASEPADTILVHPDVRRMLLNVKSTNEGMRALAYWTAIHIDIGRRHSDEAVRQEANDIVALMTPILKSYLSERGFWNVSESLQVLGGAGYTRDWSIEQMLRDTRISMIYEGTNHIQALDLVGRKLPEGMGRLYQAFTKRVSAFLKQNEGDSALAEFSKPLADALKKLNDATMFLAQKGPQDAEEAGAVASNYLNLFALTGIAYMWNLQVKVAQSKEGAFYATKVKTARFFMHNVLPEIESIAAVIQSGKQYMMALEAEEF